MSTSDSVSPVTVGFLSVIEHQQHGLFGGYLLLNLAGRPLEFHCTAPLKPNRAQEILYGPTLAPYLYGELIGRALVEKSSAQPTLICTDQEPALALQPFVAAPVLWLLDESPSESAPAANDLRIDGPHAHSTRSRPLHCGPHRLVRGAGWGDESQLAERLAALGDQFDLAEPFSRIRDAISEAQRASR